VISNKESDSCEMIFLAIYLILKVPDAFLHVCLACHRLNGSRKLSEDVSEVHCRLCVFFVFKMLCGRLFKLIEVL